MHGGSITDFQKNASVFNGTILDISGVTVTGGGAQTINAQNGFQVLNSTGTITGNTITGIGYAGPSNVYSAGVLAYGNTNLNITNNVITGANDESLAARVVGVYVFDNGPDNSGGSITGNTISHVDEGIDVSGGLGPNPMVINNNDITDIDTSDPYAGGVYFSPDGSTDDVISGSNGADYLSGGAGNDTLSGLGGNDILDGGTGGDTLNGGLGTDTAFYTGSIAGYSYGVTYDVNGFATAFTSATQTSSGDVDTLSSVEILQFSDRTLDLTAPVQLRDSTGTLVGTFTSIQAAIDAAGDNGSILVSSGTYIEQLTVQGKNGLTIAGVPGASVTILSPDVLGVNGESDYYGDNVRAVIGVTGSVNIIIRGITVDGSFSGDTTPGSNGDELAGIAYFNSSGDIDDVDIINVGNSPAGGLFGLQHGSGLFIDNSGPGDVAVSVTGSTISGFQKTGALIIGTEITFTGNTITGIGATNLTAQNGIQIAHSFGTVNNNNISGIGYTVPSGGDYYYSSGIIAYEPSGALAMDGNTITGVGLAGEFTALDLSDTAGVGVSFQNNIIVNATNGIVAYTYTGDTLGLDANPNFNGTTFSGITGQGISFDPEETYGDPFTTATAFNITGSGFADRLAGSDGDDSFTAGGGDDVLEGRGGNDNLAGGLGTDSARYSGPASGYTFTYTTDSNGYITGFSSVTETSSGDVDTLSSIETLVFGNMTFSATDAVQLFDASNNFVGSYSTIQAAINAGANGYTIRVAAGTFNEALTVDRSITILGANAGIAGSGVRGAETEITGGVSITADGVKINGVSFEGEFTPGGAPWPVGVYITGDDAHIVNSVFTTDSTTVVAAVLTGGVTGLDIGNNLFEGYPIGAYVSGTATTGSVHHNLFQGEWTPATLPANWAGMGNGVNSESASLTITQNTFDALYAGVVQVLTDSPGTLNVGGIVFDNFYTDNRADRPINIYPNGVVTTVNGTDQNENFNGDQASGAPRDFIFNGNGGDDRLFGADGNDTLNGGTGSDWLFGGNGTDTAVFAGAVSASNITYLADSNPYDVGDQAGWAVNGGGDGTDNLNDVEIVQSTSGRILLVGNGGFTTIQAAVDAAVDGDTILIAEGNFAEDVIVDVGVTILGANYGEDGASGGRNAASGAGETNVTGNWQITSTAAVTINGLRFINDATTTGGAGNPILSILTGATHNVTNSIFWSTIAGGANGVDDRAISISPIASGSVSITHNLISGTSTGAFGTASWGRGIWFDGGGVAVIITDNTGQSVRSFLNLDMSGSSTANVANNNLTNIGTFVSVGIDADGLTFTGNDFTNVGTDFNFRNLTSDVTFNASTAIDTITPAGANDPVVILGGSGNDNLTGTSGVDIIDGNNHPTLGATADNDTMFGGAGNDLLYGRNGTDTASYSEAVTAANITAVADADPLLAGDQAGWTVTTAGGTDSLVDVEIVSGSSGRVLLVGNGGFATIQEAVDAANDGDTILIAGGNYAEDVIVDVGVTILGAHHGEGGTGGGRNAASGTGETNITGNWRITSTAAVTVDGLRFVNDATTTGGAGNPIISVLTGAGHSITNSIFWSTIVGAANGDRAIQLSPIASGSVSITNNLISGTATGLFGTASWDRGVWSDGGGVAVTIDGNTFSWTRTAINVDMAGATTATISNNAITNSGSGISLGTDTDGLNIVDNDFSNVGTEFNFRNLVSAVTFDAAIAIDTLTTGSGANDTVLILGGAGADTLSGTDGADYIDGNNHPTLGATADNDILYGRAGNDFLYGRAGNDTLDGGTGDDTMDGGDGDDLLIVDSLSDVVIGGAGIDTVQTTTESYTLGSDVENLTAAGSPNALVGQGNALANVITGSSFDDTLLGLAGNDTIYGGDGSDVIVGGENDDQLYGQSGDDVMSGGAGNDIIDGGSGADIAKGGLGDDIFYVDQSDDIVMESSGQGNDLVYAYASEFTLGANVERLTYLGTGDFTGTGNGLDNIITGGTGSDTLIGGGGNDTLIGGTGANTMSGGTGDDIYYVGSRTDVIIENVGEGIDTMIVSTFKMRMGDNVENMSTTFTGDFYGVGNNLDNVMSGNIGNDFLLGKAGDDTIFGDAGNDELVGSIGIDIITGGTGADRFTYYFTDDSYAGSMDRITDFNSAEGDRIDLSMIDAIVGGAEDAFTYIGSAAFTNVAGQLRTYTSGGNTFVEGDTNGDGAADLIIQLDGVVPVGGGDFIL